MEVNGGGRCGMEVNGGGRCGMVVNGGGRCDGGLELLVYQGTEAGGCTRLIKAEWEISGGDRNLNKQTLNNHNLSSSIPTPTTREQKGTMVVLVVVSLVMVLMLDWTQASPQYGIPEPEPRPTRKHVCRPVHHTRTVVVTKQVTKTQHQTQYVDKPTYVTQTVNSYKTQTQSLYVTKTVAQYITRTVPSYVTKKVVEHVYVTPSCPSTTHYTPTTAGYGSGYTGGIDVRQQSPRSGYGDSGWEWSS
ncbi:hypothetical protein Pmani_038321 [Petrolisthes manimaculis]|uniref:Uncharacterized protein n=1 Tax=Petrolisthes manimaculis TaxID=1843537 RepID=A0AAE1TKJ7_9EUCA|nr:hypothetical protein Pmani_038321 [Petrolisthes manimaculis]